MGYDTRLICKKLPESLETFIKELKCYLARLKAHIFHEVKVNDQGYLQIDVMERYFDVNYQRGRWPIILALIEFVERKLGYIYYVDDLTDYIDDKRLPMTEDWKEQLWQAWVKAD